MASDGLWQSEDAGGIWLCAGTEVGLARVPACLCRWQDVPPGDVMSIAAVIGGTLKLSRDGTKPGPPWRPNDGDNDEKKYST